MFDIPKDCNTDKFNTTFPKDKKLTPNQLSNIQTIMTACKDSKCKDVKWRDTPRKKFNTKELMDLFSASLKNK